MNYLQPWSLSSNACSKGIEAELAVKEHQGEVALAVAAGQGASEAKVAQQEDAAERADKVVERVVRVEDAAERADKVAEREDKVAEREDAVVSLRHSQSKETTF